MSPDPVTHALWHVCPRVHTPMTSSLTLICVHKDLGFSRADSVRVLSLPLPLSPRTPPCVSVCQRAYMFLYIYRKHGIGGGEGDGGKKKKKAWDNLRCPTLLFLALRQGFPHNLGLYWRSAIPREPPVSTNTPSIRHT